MKRTELKRTPFRKTRQKRINPISAKRKKVNEENPDFRMNVIKRDGYVCRLCVAARIGLFVTDNPHPELKMQLMRLEVHHLKGRLGDLLHDEDEAIALCEWHHKYSRYSPHVSKELFNKVLEKINEHKNSH